MIRAARPAPRAPRRRARRSPRLPAGLPALIIGYGNDLRGDDAAGPRVAAAVAAWHLPGVAALGVGQLTPELAEPIAQARLVLFVDAGAVARLLVAPIRPAAHTSALGHTGDPGALLALAGAVYGACPPAWLITVPAAHFELGRALSPLAACGVAQATRSIRMLIRAGGRP